MEPSQSCSSRYSSDLEFNFGPNGAGGQSLSAVVNHTPDDPRKFESFLCDMLQGGNKQDQYAYTGSNLRPGASSSGKSNMEDANKELFDPVYQSIEGPEVLARGKSGSVNGRGRQLDSHGHVATSGDITVETSDCRGPTAMLVSDQHHKDAIDVTTPERSEERRVGKECSEPCRSRWSPYH